MARRRKTEVKASEKSSHKYVPVRKSSRQIAKKQLEEKKINGNILETSCSNSLENSKSTNEDHSRVLSKRNQNFQKKHSKHKGTSSNNIAVNKEDIVYNASQYKRDAGESDSQDYIDNIINESEKLSPEDVRQVVVGNPSDESLPTSTPIPTEVEMWTEDVIEETIICEEMEMEDVADNSYTLAENNVMVEQVLLVNEPNLEDKNFVEFTVIQDEDESMVITSNTENISNNEYIIQENFNSVHSNELENSISTAHTNESTLSGGNCNIVNSNMDKPYINKKKIVLENRGKKQKNDKTIYDKIRKEISESISDKVRMCSIKENSDVSSEEIDCKQEGKNSKVKSIVHTDLSKEDTFSKIDSELANMQINECSKEIQKLVNDLSSVESVDSPVQTSLNIEKLSPINIDDESSSSILDKMEQLHRPNNSVSSHMTEIFSKTVEPNNIIKNQEQNMLKSNSCDDKLQYTTDQVLLKSKNIQDKKNMTQQKNPEHLTTMEEYQDSEGDNSKVDCEDIKLCSSSENSNDTLLSLNCKGRELDVKNATGNTSDIDKKIEFRGRSGSTDTTGSESGSNSSGVRRSSRIRSIGLMKQRYNIK